MSFVRFWRRAVLALAISGVWPVAMPAIAQGVSSAACAQRAEMLGVERIVEIDATGGPRFGQKYREKGFLADGEVVLTFDDGPSRLHTSKVLEALETHCTKATFFTVGRMAVADPAILQEVKGRGHTIALHTWSHKNMEQLSAAMAEEEFELGLSAVAAAAAGPVAPFFRFPYLRDPESVLKYLGTRDTAVFGIDIDSRDFKTRSAAEMQKTVLTELTRKRKGIILFHDIQTSTAKGLKGLLDELKTRGFKVVHVVPKATATTVAAYDARAAKILQNKKLAATQDPLASRAVVWPMTGDTEPPPDASGAGPDPDDPDAVVGPPPPASRPAPRRRPTAVWTDGDDDPWTLRSFGR